MLFWARANGNAFEKLSIVFEMYDLNGSGEIDFNELHSIVKTLLKLKYSDNGSQIDSSSKFETILFQDQILCNSKLPLSYNIAMYIMRKLDSNRNAKLTKEEFVKGCLFNENIRIFLTPLKIL
jgi:Ca2+-binding EF-hand superfamily protein